MEFYNGVCGLDEAKRLLEEGLCPPPDRSVIREGERLILGGDPAKKTTLPPGAECPAGFERLPQDWKPEPGLWFRPTCWDVAYATRIPEPAILDGQYILSGLDAFYLADPGATWAASLEWINAGAYYWAVPLLPKPWPEGALQAYPAPTIEDRKMRVCAAKDAPWVDMDRREVVAQYGGFFVNVRVRNFRTDTGCTIPWFDIMTYCCGPILMLWPEEIAELRASLGKRCEAIRDYYEYLDETSMYPQDKGWAEKFFDAVVAPRTKGLEWMGLKPTVRSYGPPGNGHLSWEPEVPTTARDPACQVCLGHEYLWFFSECDTVFNDGEDPDDYEIRRQCLLSTICGANVSYAPMFELELDGNGYPSLIIKGSYASPYRTPDEVAKDIPPP